MLNGNVADASAYTKVEKAVIFVRETNIIDLAIAIGTVHGVYEGIPKLDYERLHDIRKAVSVPLVMHGGSKLSPEAFRLAIQNCINHYFTEMSLGVTDTGKIFIEERKWKR